MGSRLSTAIQTGLFSFNLRRGVLAENVQAAAILSLISGVFLAFAARLLCEFLGGTELTIFDYVVISTVGGMIAGVLLLGITVVVARLSVEREWDMDNSGAHDHRLRRHSDPPRARRGNLPDRHPRHLEHPRRSPDRRRRRGRGDRLPDRPPSLRRILAESLPILALTGMVTILVGVALEDRMEAFVALPALFILLPAFLREGPLGGMLSSRLSSKIHLGLLEPRGLPPVDTFRDFTLIYTFATGVYLFIGGVPLAGRGTRHPEPPPRGAGAGCGPDEPGLPDDARRQRARRPHRDDRCRARGLLRLDPQLQAGLDPDTYGIPIITSAVDLLGFMSLIIALVVFQLA